MNDKYISTAPLYESGDYLAHYGVPGMKRGVNRYRNPDGTLTEEGKRHYGIGLNRRLNRGIKKYNKLEDRQRRYNDRASSGRTVYDLNAKTYSKGNSRFAKQMTGMNKAAKRSVVAAKNREYEERKKQVQNDIESLIARADEKKRKKVV